MAFAGIFQSFARLRWIRFGLLMRDPKFSRRFSVPQTPQFEFTEAVSFVINCDTQEEIDPAAAGLGETHRWRRGGTGMRMGREQVPTLLAGDTGKFFAEWVKDPAGLQRVTHEVWQMKKLDLAKLEKA